MTSELDAEPERRIAMPEDTPVPFVVAAALLAGVLALLFAWYWAAGAAAVVAAIGIGYWLWPFMPPTEALQEPVPHPEEVS